jgi:hypothetical protein
MKPQLAHGHLRWLVIPAIFLIAFCWLGFASAKFAPIYQGLEDRLPAATRFSATYGWFAYPLFGLVAALAVILADIRFRGPWVWWTVIVVFTMLVLLAFRSLLFSGVFMTPAIGANKSCERTAAVASRAFMPSRVAAVAPLDRMLAGLVDEHL